ncbi:MAG TPA: PDZ domain-containing protein [Acidimicrobiia bacterium]|nr:PDZ domain-containing protein [Acidimicrobiia bacterium]
MSDDTPEPTEEQATVETPSTEPAPTESKSDTIHVPKWVVFVVAALVLFGGGFGIGWAAAPGGHNGPVFGGRFERPFGPGGAFVNPGDGSGGFQGGGGGRFQIPAPANQNGAYLGVETGAASGSQGVSVVNVVSGGPADQAGLKAGDVITAVNGTAVSSPAALAQQIQSHQPGDQVTITYTRSGSSAQVSVKLGSRSDTTTPTAPPS